MTEEAPAFPVARECPYTPPKLYQDFREESGLHQVTIWNGSRPYLATRYDDVRTVLTEDKLSADVTKDGFPLTSAAQPHLEGGVFLRLDNPEHDRIRRMLTREFSVRNSFARKPEITRLVDELIDGILADGGPVDLIPRFATPIPMIMISEIVGVPADEREYFTQLVVPLADLTAPPERKHAVIQEMATFFAGLVENKHAEPGDDLTSRVIREFVDTGQLSDAELTKILMILFGAGQETTSNMLGLAILALLEHPDQLQRLREDPAVVPSATEELLRYFSIVQTDPRRVATEDVEVAGCPVRAGEGVMVSLMAANHDPRVFGEDGDKLDVTRNPRNHLSFGYGVHQCLGQNLARAELHVALPRLFERIPGLRLAVPFDQLHFHDNMLVYGLHALPVTW